MNAFIDGVFLLSTCLTAVLMLQAGSHMVQFPGVYAFWKGAICIVIAMTCVAAVVLHIWNGGLS